VKELLDVVTRVYEYQRPHPALVGTASGLETVRLALQGKLPTPPIIATLGISPVDASEGRCIFEGSPAEWQYNHIETVHGGWLSALLDSALGGAVQTVLPGGCGFTRLDLHVRF
jgi:acyl-coenzyme A thioesterase PaaI-like protein